MKQITVISEMCHNIGSAKSKLFSETSRRKRQLNSPVGSALLLSGGRPKAGFHGLK